MKRTYDLHIHSCLSPCGDDEMTPASIAGMAKLGGLDIAALTDHNATRNCPAFFTACRAYGIVPVAGCELTTSEDIHLVVLFPSLASALDFDSDLSAHRILFPNRPEIFGHQLVMNEEDRVLGEEPHVLTTATDISVSDAVHFAQRYGAIVYPAHIDRESNGAVAVLGDFPHDVGFSAYELHFGQNAEQYRENYRLGGMPHVISSDAHVLWDISDGENALFLDGEGEDEIRASLFAYLRGGAK